MLSRRHEKSLRLFTWYYQSQHVRVFYWHRWHDGASQQDFGGCHVVLRHVRGDDLGSQCPIEGLQVPEYPLCASCSECGVIALLARVHVGPCAVPPPPPPPPPRAHCQTILHTASLTHPTTTQRHPTPHPGPPSNLTPQPTSSPKTLPPITTSPLFHIPRGTLVKSNPIIRHSAVREKKENFPLVNSRLPFFLFPLPSFHPKWRQDDTVGPLGQLPLAFFWLDLSFLPSFLSLPHSLCLFVTGVRLPLCWSESP